MAEEQKQQSQGTGGSGAPPRREGGPSGPRREGGGHAGPRREGGPGGGPGGPRRGKRQYFRKKKVCKFCVEKIDFIDYKRTEYLVPYVQEKGKILPRRLTGTCSRHQRWLGVAIKRARNIALMPYATSAAGVLPVHRQGPAAGHAAAPAPATATPAPSPTSPAPGADVPAQPKPE
jgi:small subunit ribosomal protein S18